VVQDVYYYTTTNFTVGLHTTFRSESCNAMIKHYAKRSSNTPINKIYILLDSISKEKVVTSKEKSKKELELLDSNVLLKEVRILYSNYTTVLFTNQYLEALNYIVTKTSEDGF
jgi:hypothetical protein